MLKANLKQTKCLCVTSSSFFQHLLGCSLLILCTQVYASSEPKSEITDSVFTWGMWEYNIAPAAGDLQGHTASPLNPRSAKVTLRTNSNSALAPTSTAALTPNIRPAVPVTTPVPTAPPAPIIITQGPPVVIPTITAPAAATPTPPKPVSPPPAPNVGTSPGAAPISGTPLNLGF